MKDLMIEWVENHKGENTDGTWFRLDMDWVEDNPENPKKFATEQELDEWLWNYIFDNSDCLFNL